MKHYLMIKTHNVTGLKYLCKTSTDDSQKPFKYYGSGKYWLRHLKVHGYNISTEILKVCHTKEELMHEGIKYSKLFDVVKSEQFANMIEERGDGGCTMLGRKMTLEQNAKKSKSLRLFYLNASKEYMTKRNFINSKCHEIYEYHTPNGIFHNAYEAAISNNCSNVTIINRCRKDVDKPIMSRRYWKFGWKGKTWRQLGWSCVLLHAQS